MRFNLDGLEVFFPYDYLYTEQFDYMLDLKRALDNKGHGLLEMPTGTGKTVCLVALITSYQFAHPSMGKLIYCTRTVPEMVKCMEEIKRVIDYRVQCVGPKGGDVLALSLSSRRNLCIHPRILQESDREAVDSVCRSMTASWVRTKAGVKESNNNASARGHSSNSSSSSASSSGNRSSSSSSSSSSGSSRPALSSGSGSTTGRNNIQLCNFYENYDQHGSHADVPRGVYAIDDLKSFGEQKGWCPYFLARQLINHANILVYNYQYMLDPKVSNLVSRELEAESVVVFDEAHNIDNVCIEALSVTLDKKSLDASARGINTLQSQVATLKQNDTERLRREYSDLVNGLAGTGTTGTQSHEGTDAVHHPNTVLANPLLPDDILQEAVPGSIRRAEHFVIFLKKLVEFLKRGLGGNDAEEHTPLSYLHKIHDSTALERKPMRFTYTRLNSLLRTLEVTSLDDFAALTQVANFATLLATYLEGFSVVIEPQGSVVAGVQEPLLQLCCLDASIAIKPCLDRFQSVIITSGTLSPIDLYPKLLGFSPKVRTSLPMSVFRHCLLPLIVTKGSDQTPITTAFEKRKEENVVRNYGELVLDTCTHVPDGVCVFFTSYSFMEHVVTQWDAMGIMQKIVKSKLVFLETKDVVETTLALDNFKRACDSGRGAVFLSVARGKVAEGIDFDRHYGRAVLLLGIPYQYTKSKVLRSRLNFLLKKHQIQDQDFMTFDALRQSAQCIGRVIRSKTDYGIVVLADARFNKKDKRSKFPPWVTQFIRESFMNLSTDLAVEKMRSFLRVMGQPIDKESLHSILMDENQVAARAQSAGVGGSGEMFVPADHAEVPEALKGPLPRDSRRSVAAASATRAVDAAMLPPTPPGVDQQQPVSMEVE